MSVNNNFSSSFINCSEVEQSKTGDNFLNENNFFDPNEATLLNNHEVLDVLPELNSTIEEDLNALTSLSISDDPTYAADDVLEEANSKTAIKCNEISYVRYKDETQMPAIMHLITKDLSEPYSIYTYRYFIHNWPHLCYLAIYKSKYVGAIVCKLDVHKKITRRGYIAMLAVDKSVRRKRIGTNLVKLAIGAMQTDGCDEVVLETEVTNNSALQLYENLGFVRDKRLFRYYLNGVDALRLKLWLC